MAATEGGSMSEGGTRRPDSGSGTESGTGSGSGTGAGSETGTDELTRLRDRVGDLEGELRRLRQTDDDDRTTHRGRTDYYGRSGRSGRDRYRDDYRDRPRDDRDRSRSEYGARDRGYGRVRDYDSDEAISDFRDLSGRKQDEVSRLFRGLVRASLEGFRVAAEATSDAVDEVLTWNTPERDESPADAARHLPADVTRGLIRAVDDALEIPSRSAETFNRTFSDPEERGRPRRRRSRRSARRTEAASHERYEDWATSELYDRAVDLGIEGRATMDREQLIGAIREHEASPRVATASAEADR